METEETVTEEEAPVLQQQWQGKGRLGHLLAVLAGADRQRPLPVLGTVGRQPGRQGRGGRLAAKWWRERLRSPTKRWSTPMTGRWTGGGCHAGQNIGEAREKIR